MSYHTQGPLRVHGTRIRDLHPGIDCIATMQVSNQPIWDQDARRLVACWNACEGISTDSLEMAAACGGLRDVSPTAMAIAQRDNLLEALLLARDHLDMAALEVSHCKDAERIRAAIAKATGELFNTTNDRPSVRSI